MQDNIYDMKNEINNSIKETKPKYKELLGKISKATLNISDITWKKNNEKLNGFVEVSITLKDLGFSRVESYVKFNKELFSNYMVDFIGELIVRNNINKFVNDFFLLEKQEYSNLVSIEHHLHFGAKVVPGEKDNKIIYIFHCSLLQNILTEEFKNNVLFL